MPTDGRAGPETGAAGPQGARRLFVYNGGLLKPRIRRILALAGWQVRLGLPTRTGDWVGVWGRSPTAPRGEAVAAARAAPLLRVEDAFLRGLFPGRSGEPPLGLLLDRSGVHFDPSVPSDLETLLATHPLDDPALLGRARAAIARLQAAALSRFAATDPDLPPPDPGFVLVVDQAAGDAAVTASGATPASFRAMLAAARAEHPDAAILVKRHPETVAGHRPGHLARADLPPGAAFLDGPHTPWRLLERARAVYTVSSGLGFEAILAGHRPSVFGAPFYAGWGLTEDRGPPLPRRGRPLTPEQLFAAAMILLPAWYDPFRDRLCPLERVIDTLEAEARAWREDRLGWSAAGISRWKRPHLAAFFGRHGPGVAFSETPRAGRRHMVWASAAAPEAPGVRVEDGFLRSRGLGAALTPPLSLVADDLGIYYDPSRESRLERLIAASATLPPSEIERAERLIARITAAGLSKYNISADPPPDLPPGRRILVPGQVEDDASIRLGAGATATNAALLALVRQRNPGAVIVYKPHPDVEAGLRRGALPQAPGADVVADRTDPARLLAMVDEVWTMTSLLGFEALLRGLPVTTTGAPFYAGWGLTADLGEIPARRTARPPLAGLVHAALIAYPRYRDPRTGRPCPVEVVVERLARGEIPPPGPARRWAGALQRLLPGRRR